MNKTTLLLYNVTARLAAEQCFCLGRVISTLPPISRLYNWQLNPDRAGKVALRKELVVIGQR